jgi:hypothetical protein
MGLTMFVIFQLAFDVVILLAVCVGVLRCKSRAAVEPRQPSQGHQEFLRLVHDRQAETAPGTEAHVGQPRGMEPSFSPERPRAPVDDGARRDRRREALDLLRAGADPAEVARRGRLSPGELRLLRNVVAAEMRLATSRQQ